MIKENEKIDIHEDEREFLNFYTDESNCCNTVEIDKSLKNKILDLEKQLQTMEKKMDKILELLEKDCKKMTDHIDFVENVYDNIKMPFNYVMYKVNNLVSNGERETPSLLPARNLQR